MSDDRKRKGPEDGKRIALTEAHEVSYWTRVLRITKAKLAAVVRAVGHAAKRVRKAIEGDA